MIITSNTTLLSAQTAAPNIVCVTMSPQLREIPSRKMCDFSFKIKINESYGIIITSNTTFPSAVTAAAPILSRNWLLLDSLSSYKSIKN